MTTNLESIDLSFISNLSDRVKFAIGLFIFGKLQGFAAVILLFAGVKVLPWIFLAMAILSVFGSIVICLRNNKQKQGEIHVRNDEP